MDIKGNLLFALGLTAFLVGVTYGLQPYGSATMGWSNPFVLACIIGGVLALVIFVFVEPRVPEPCPAQLFRIRMFTAGNIAVFLSALARRGLNLILIIWLQGIWFPLHGYAFKDTPLWAGIYMLPLTGGFLFAGPLCGHLSDRYGARGFSTTGMMIVAAAFAGLVFMPIDFAYPLMAVALLLVGIGMGMFAAPNTTAIMNSVPPEHRGASSGMRATFQNMANTLSITMIFTVVIVGLSSSLPKALFEGLTNAGIPVSAAHQVASSLRRGRSSLLSWATTPWQPCFRPTWSAPWRPTGGHSSWARKLPSAALGPIQGGLTIAFLISSILCIVAALASWMRGKRVIYGVRH